MKGAVTRAMLEQSLARVEEHMKEVIASNDRRYEQRFIDSQTAVSAALTAAQTAVAAAMAAAEKAVTKAEMASEKRFEGVNEFRGTLADQQRMLMPRQEADLRMSGVEGRIDKLEKANIEVRSTKAGARDTWALIIGGVLFLLSVVTFILARKT